jgi:UDP-glucose 4-epimerase
MILITGGRGFIGSHTTRALLDLGKSCVLVQRRAAEVADPAVAVEQVDITDRSAFLEIGSRHHITGIVHLAGAFGTHGPIEAARRETQSLLTVLEAAQEWGVRRVGTASTIGVYGGAAGGSPFREDALLPMMAVHPIPAFKKIGELLTDYVSGATGIEILSYRIAAVWGPGGRPASPFFAAPHLVHSAVNGTTPPPTFADNGIDACYVKDCGRAIALLQLADRLAHRTYNIGTGRATTNAEVAAAIGKVVPTARIELTEGRDPNGPDQDTYLDIARLCEDTGYRPGYDTERAVADYVEWLRAGNKR